LKTVYIATKKSGAQGYFLQMFDNPPFPHQSAQNPATPAAKPSTILDLTPVASVRTICIASAAEYW
jgi:hypothetical protein